MAVSLRHVLEQRAMLRTLGGAALTAFKTKTKAAEGVELPGAWISRRLPAPSDALIRAFVKSVGGDPSAYRGIIPPHLFSQWAIPVAFEAMAGQLSYPLTRVINAGCKLEQKRPLVAIDRLQVNARVESIDEDSKRAIITTKVVTDDALTAEIKALIPLAPGRSEKKHTALMVVPTDAREIAFVRLDKDAGLDFAKLTGDFNPIHWVPAYARRSGFRSTIMHGFGTFALAFEAIVRRVLSGNASALRSIEARFTKPLTLPNHVGVYVTEQSELFVGNALGAPAYLKGSYEHEQ